MPQYISWNGISGKTYQTELCIPEKPFVSNPGVYIFCKQLVTGHWSPIYVGECECFNDRLNLNLANHHQISNLNKHGATHVCVVPVSGGKQARVNVETDLRHGLNPPCNMQ